MASYRVKRAVYSLCAVVAASSFAAGSPAAEIKRFSGVCDSSAAVPVGSSHVFVVGNDENPRLGVYSFDSAKPYTEDLKLNKIIPGVKKNTEMEIEGATMLGDVSYWISSHARDKSGNLDKDRQWLFGLKLAKEGKSISAKLIGMPYRDLLKDLLSSPLYSSFQFEDLSKEVDISKASKSKNGFNIEGLTAWNEDLLIGLRAPLKNQKAILIPLLNPNGVLEGKRAKFGAAIFLDLKGLGIRSIEHIDNAYWIIAGRYDRASEFRLFKWSGKASEKPVEIDDIAFGDLNPESLFAFKGEKKIRILSDDGKRILTNRGEQFECGKALEKGLPVYFRAVTYGPTSPEHRRNSR